MRSNPRQAQLGGRPTAASKVAAYVNVRLKRHDQWALPNLEIYNGEPIYAHIYFLLRAGRHRDAVSYLENNCSDYLDRTASSFGGAFREALQCTITEGKMMNKQVSSIIEQEWSRTCARGYDIEGRGIDPFKVALWKWMGKCDVHNPGSATRGPSERGSSASNTTSSGKKGVAGVTSTSTEDWLWFQVRFFNLSFD